jgi:DNA polymerase-3 subunit epsilon
MREIVLDTETTGFEPETGDRIVEIGAVELINHMPTGKVYHQYVNPERDMPESAFAVHGLSEAFLSDFPTFRQVGQAFLDFIGEARLVIHNAPFDMKFLNAELGWMGLNVLPMDRALDTLAMAKSKFPGSPASLDALCKRFGVDNSSRTKHGALLDSEILAEVYLELIGGRQAMLVLAGEDRREVGGPSRAWKPRPRPAPLSPRLTEEERAAHAAFISGLGDGALWSR